MKSNRFIKDKLIHSSEELYAIHYDALVHNSYNASLRTEEMSFLNYVLQEKQADRTKTKILDAGCGTGRHIVYLAQSDFNVTGIDKSPFMLRECEKKLKYFCLQDVKLHNRDITLLTEIEHKYDIIICMNSVISYCYNKYLRKQFLLNFYNMLQKGGLLVLEIWNLAAQKSLIEEVVTCHVEGPDYDLFYRRSHVSRKNPCGMVVHFDVEVYKHVHENYTFSYDDHLTMYSYEECISDLETTGFEIAFFYGTHDKNIKGSDISPFLIFGARKTL